MRLGKTRGAERVLRRLLRRDPDSPVLQARLAEALHKRRGTKAIEALELLDKLEERDLVPDAHGYVALAYLRRRTGDVDGHGRAMQRCRAMTASKTLCWTP
jgi:predicted Zn-dependent protease